MISRKFAFETFCLSRRNEEIFFRVVQFKGHKNPDHVIIFLHGLGNDALYPQVSLLSEISQTLGTEVISFDIDGHGKESFGAIDFSKPFKNLLAVLDYYVNTKGKEFVHLIGYSLGGAICFDLLTREDLTGEEHELMSKVKSLCMIATPIKIEINLKVALHEFLSIASPSFYGILKNFGIWQGLPALGSFKRGDFPVRLEYLKGPDYISATDQYFKNLSESSIYLNRIIDVSLIYGDKDFIATEEARHCFYHKMKASHSILIEGSNHFLLLVKENIVQKVLGQIKKGL